MPRFVGNWAKDQQSCQSAAWKFTDSTLRTPGGESCSFNRVTPAAGGYDIEATCTAKGSPEADTLTIRFAESAKAMLFSPERSAVAVVDVDDGWGERLLTLRPDAVPVSSGSGTAAGVGLDQPGHHVEQGGLAVAVAADHADPLAGGDAEGDLGEQRADAVRLGDPLEVHEIGADLRHR